MVYQPEKLDQKNAISSFKPYGIIDGKIDDPNKSTIVGILTEFNEISSRIKQLEEEIKNFNEKKDLLTKILLKKIIDKNNQLWE